MHSPLVIDDVMNTHTDKNTYIIPYDLWFGSTTVFPHWIILSVEVLCVWTFHFSFSLYMLSVYTTHNSLFLLLLSYVCGFCKSVWMTLWHNKVPPSLPLFFGLSGNSNHGNAQLINHVTQCQHYMSALHLARMLQIVA